MRALPVLLVALLGAGLVAEPAAGAAPKKKHPVVAQSHPGHTVIQPTRTIIHNRDGTTTIIVTPRRRSYLDPGNEVSVGEGSYHDYIQPPAGDPGRSDWWYGPDHSGGAFYMEREPFYLPGINPYTPY